MVLNGTILNLGTAAGAALNGGLIALSGYPALGIVLPVFAFAAAILAAWLAGPVVLQATDAWVTLAEPVKETIRFLLFLHRHRSR